MIFLANSLVGNGAEKVMLTVAKEISLEQPVEIWILKNDIDIEVPDIINVKVIVPQLFQKNKILSLFIAALFIVKNTHRNPLIINSFLLRASMVNILAKRIGSNHKAVIHEHSIPSKLIGNSLILQRLYRYIYKKSDRILAVSQGVANEIEKVSKNNVRNKIYVVPNPCEIEKINALSKIELTDIKFPYIVAVGRLEKIKRFDLLIKSFSNTKDTGYLYILGSGKEAKNLQTLIKENNLEEKVFIIPWTNNPYKYIKNAKALVLTSMYESFSMVILESLACGTPIISIDCPYGPREILSSGKYGILINEEKENVEIRLTEEIDIVLKSKEEKNSDHLICRAKDYDHSSILNVYKKLLI